jgi:hypothetical protein
MTRFFKLVYFELRDLFSFPYSPDAVLGNYSFEPCLVISTRTQQSRGSNTFKKVSSKVDASVAIPKISSATLDHIRNALGVELFKPYQNSICGPKSNNYFRDP